MDDKGADVSFHWQQISSGGFWLEGACSKALLQEASLCQIEIAQEHTNIKQGSPLCPTSYRFQFHIKTQM